MNSQRIVAIITFSFLFCLGAENALGQSTDQNFPTPVTSGTITGTIKARDIGDSRRTRYYFLVQGDRGDLFVNIVTKNINGSIDVFTKTGLRPRTKVALFADDTETETGRVIYLRESEQLIIRIQGRTPGDDDGTFQIKFAGAFRAMVNDGSSDDPFGDRTAGGNVRVNSAGAIIRPTPSTDESDKENEQEQQRETDKDVAAKRKEVEAETGRRVRVIGEKSTDSESTVAESKKESKDAERSGETVKTDVKSTQSKPVLKDQGTTIIRIPRSETEAKKTENVEERDSVRVELTKEKPKRSTIVRIERSKDEPKAEETEKSKLESTNLVIEFANGGRLVKPMSDVLKFAIDEGKFTLITKDGFIRRFSILEVSKVSIEPIK